MTEERYVSYDQARQRLIALFNQFGKLGFEWSLPPLRREDAKELMAETRQSGWRIRSNYVGDRWKIWPATNWQKIVLTTEQLPRADAIPNPGEAAIAARTTNAGLRLEVRNKLREALLTLGGIEMVANQGKYFPALVSADLRAELKIAGWYTESCYLDGESVVKIAPRPRAFEAGFVSSEYLLIPHDHRLPSPAEATAAALEAQSDIIELVRIEVARQLGEIRAKEARLAVPECSGVVRNWLHDRLYEAGWIVHDYPFGSGDGDKRWTVKPAIHRRRQEAAMSRYLPTPVFNEPVATAGGEFLRQRTLALVQATIVGEVTSAEGPGATFLPNAVLSDGMNGDLPSLLKAAKVAYTRSSSGAVASKVDVTV